MAGLVILAIVSRLIFSSHGDFQIFPSCPPCDCFQQGVINTANCTGRKLIRIPESIPPSTNQLLFRDNNLHTLRENQLSYFTNLTFLDLSNNSLTLTENTPFSGLKYLRNLSLAHNNISEIGNTSFNGLENLDSLNMSNCNLTKIPKATFSPLKSIKELDLSENPHIGWDGLIEATFGVQNSPLQKLNINKIVRDLAICSVVDYTICNNLKNTSLTEIYTDRNRIEIFHDQCFEVLPKTLKKVSLRQNRLTFGMYLKDLPLLVGLEELDISTITASPYLPNIDRIPIDNMECVDIQTCQDNRQHHANIRSLWMPTNADNFVFYNISPNLKRFRCAYSKLSYHIDNITVSKNSLIDLDLSHNLFSTWTGPVIGLEKLLYLNLSNNVARNYSFHFFENFPELKTLDISQNFLGKMLSKDKTGQAFRTLKNLEVLNMSHNLVPLLPDYVFNGLTSLRVLDISNNYMQSWFTYIDHMKNLKKILAASNRLRWLPIQTRKTLDILNLKSNVTIFFDLSQNPIDCTCENLEFLHWLLNSKVEFGNFSNYFCIYSDAHTADFSNLNQIYTSLYSDCTRKFVFNLAIIFVSFIIVFLMLTGLLYRHRWKLRYWYYSAKLQKSRLGNSSETVFEFDAFVSYADEDQHFVEEQLRVKLEEEADLRLILRNRDFSNSGYEIQNIVNAVHISKRTIIVLSDNFFTRYLCEKELEMANFEQVETERNVILVIIYRTLTRKDLPSEIVYKIRNHSYLEYPGNECDSGDFWRALITALDTEK